MHETLDEDLNGSSYEVGFRRPPLHSRFKPGQSGNPSGRPKGSLNLRTLLEKILKEEISLREGSETKKLTKAEAIVRSLVIGALKGDSRSQSTLLKLAELSGQFEEQARPQEKITQIILTGVRSENALFPASSPINRDHE